MLTTEQRAELAQDIDAELAARHRAQTSIDRLVNDQMLLDAIVLLEQRDLAGAYSALRLLADATVGHLDIPAALQHLRDFGTRTNAAGVYELPAAPHHV